MLYCRPMPDTPGITDILGLGKVGATAIEVTAKFLERIDASQDEFFAWVRDNATLTR